jgi:hypothetical protein
MDYKSSERNQAYFSLTTLNLRIFFYLHYSNLQIGMLFCSRISFFLLKKQLLRLECGDGEISRIDFIVGKDFFLIFCVDKLSSGFVILA